MTTLLSILRGIAAIIVGYAIIVIFAILFQDVSFGGLSLAKSPWHHLLIGGSMTVVGALIAGYVMPIIANRQPYIYAWILAIWVLAEGIYLWVAGITTNPLLFDIAASSSLSIGVLVGCYYRVRQRGARVVM